MLEKLSAVSFQSPEVTFVNQTVEYPKKLNSNKNVQKKKKYFMFVCVIITMHVFVIGQLKHNFQHLLYFTLLHLSNSWAHYVELQI